MGTTQVRSDQFVIVADAKAKKEQDAAEREAARSELLVSIRMDMKDRRFEAARVSLQLALSIDGSDAVCLALLGRCKAEVKPDDCDDAVRLCEAAVTRVRTPETLFQLGRVYLLNGRRGDAVEAFEAGLALNPGYPPILDEFERIGRRRPKSLPAISRNSFLNRHIGRFRAKLGLP